MSEKENKKPRFRTAFDLSDDARETGEYPRTRLEIQLMTISQDIRAKPKWYEKIHNKKIITKWKKEAESPSQIDGKAQVTPDMMDYVISELLNYYSKLVDLPLIPAPCDGVYEAESLIDPLLKSTFLEQVAVMEKVPSDQLDWHPGSNHQVLDLVHPSLFCLVHGVSRIIPDPLPWSKSIGSGEVQYVEFKGKKRMNLSYKYQWLPSEFSVDPNGKVSIDSYINNLHPITHAGMYASVASIFEKFVPLFNRVLTDLRRPAIHRLGFDIDYEKEEDEVSESDDTDEAFRKRGLILPEVSELKIPSIPEEKYELQGRKLQVIVKIAEIILTPENPVYEGGVWHVEGMENENIVATGIYYFGSENITKSKLLFREAVCEPEYQQNDTYGPDKLYGLFDQGPLVQRGGYVITKEDKCIAFPNVFQHKVARFRLEDETRPGHRKILVFFLVNPEQRITSTATVPPQQRSWFEMELKRVMKGTYLEKLPKDILDLVLSYLDWPMDLKDAKEHREALMTERKYFVDSFDKELFARPFSLCEH